MRSTVSRGARAAGLLFAGASAGIGPPAFAQDASDAGGPVDAAVESRDAFATDGALPPPSATASGTVTAPGTVTALPPDAAPVEPPTPILAGESRFAISPEVALSVLPPHSWEERPETGVEIDEIQQMSGAEMVVEHAWSMDHPKPDTRSDMFVICVSGPASDWAPGMESLLFERLNAIAKAELGKTMAVGNFTSSPVEEAAPVFRQSFEASGKAGGNRKEGSVRVLEVDRLDSDRAEMAAHGRHVLGFLANPDRVLVCSAACAEPQTYGGGVCSPAMSTFRIDGSLAPEPSPSLTGRLLIGVERRPAALLGAALGLILALAGVLALLRGLTIRPQTSE